MLLHETISLHLQAIETCRIFCTSRWDLSTGIMQDADILLPASVCPLASAGMRLIARREAREAGRDAHLLTQLRRLHSWQILRPHWMQQEPWLPQTTCRSLQDRARPRSGLPARPAPSLPGVPRLPGLSAAPLWRCCRPAALVSLSQFEESHITRHTVSHDCARAVCEVGLNQPDRVQVAQTRRAYDVGPH